MSLVKYFLNLPFREISLFEILHAGQLKSLNINAAQNSHLFKRDERRLASHKNIYRKGSECEWQNCFEAGPQKRIFWYKLCNLNPARNWWKTHSSNDNQAKHTRRINVWEDELTAKPDLRDFLFQSRVSAKIGSFRDLSPAHSDRLLLWHQLSPLLGQPIIPNELLNHLIDISCWMLIHKDKVSFRTLSLGLAWFALINSLDKKDCVSAPKWPP